MYEIALFSLLAYALSTIFLKKIVNDGFFTLVYTHLLAVIVLFIAFFQYIQIPNNFLFIILAGIFGSLSVFMSYKALSLHKASLIVPFSSLSGIFTPILGFLMFGEKLSIFNVVAIPIIFLGIFIIAYKKEEKIDKSLIKPILFAIIGSVFGTSFNIITKVASFSLNAQSLSLYLETSILLFLIFMFFIFKEKVPKKIKHHEYFLSGIFLAIGAILFYISVIQIGIGITIIILSTSPLVVNLLARIILKEVLSRNQYIGILLMGIGLILANL